MCVYLIYNIISTFETLNVYKTNFILQHFMYMNLVQYCLYLHKTTYYMYYSALIQVHSTACTSSTCLYGVPLEAEPRLNFDL